MAAPLAELLTANVQFINSGEEDTLKMAPPKAAVLPVMKQLIKLLGLVTIFFTIEKPIPVPEYCPFPCKRWKASNIFVACSFLKPIPLSVIFMAYYSRCFTAARYSISFPSIRSHVILISGIISGRQCLMAFPYRFIQSCESCIGSPFIVRRFPHSMIACFSAMRS
jgi:hypothetical protein